VHPGVGRADVPDGLVQLGRVSVDEAPAGDAEHRHLAGRLDARDEHGTARAPGLGLDVHEQVDERAPPLRDVGHGEGVVDARHHDHGVVAREVTVSEHPPGGHRPHRGVGHDVDVDPATRGLRDGPREVTREPQVVAADAPPDGGPAAEQQHAIGADAGSVRPGDALGPGQPEASVEPAIALADHPAHERADETVHAGFLPQRWPDRRGLRVVRAERCPSMLSPGYRAGQPQVGGRRTNAPVRSSAERPTAAAAARAGRRGRPRRDHGGAGRVRRDTPGRPPRRPTPS